MIHLENSKELNKGGGKADHSINLQREIPFKAQFPTHRIFENIYLYFFGHFSHNFFST